MKTIAENLKYPEFQEQYKHAQWIAGHLVKIGDMYYAHHKRTLVELSYEELNDAQRGKVAEYEEKVSKTDAEAVEMRKEIRAKQALKAWAMENAHEVGRSNQSESEYYHVRHTDGKGYTIRISGHRYPTGSMTDLAMGVIDTTDFKCSRYCDMLGVDY